ncbi:MAG TPA: TIM-barrel domain-containing protein [Candidatus Obscuribacterales bacterium]
MADVTTSILDELKKRQNNRRYMPRERGKNIFEGEVQCHHAKIGMVQAVRLSVAPGSQPVPQSLAIATVFDWHKSASLELPLGITWQQTSVGCWDFHFALTPAARCFGLGERFSGLNVRGRKHTLCTTDETKHTEFADAMYKAIPFMLLSQADGCYGLFLDSPAPQRWDLASTLNDQASIQLLSRRGWQLYVMGPGSLPEIVSAYTELTGRHSLPPLWALGHQQCRWSYADEATVLNIASEFRTRKIPCDTIVLDIDYMDEYRVFTSSKERFPGFDTLAQRVAEQGFKLITIVDPGVKRDTKYQVYKQAIEENLVCKGVEGEPFVETVWPGECVFPDFERPDARKWWAELHEFYVKRGIAGIWNDMNEPSFLNTKGTLAEPLDEMPPADEQMFVQRSPEGTVGHLEVRNRYGSLMCRSTYEGLHELRPNERSFVLTRAAYAGVQRYSAVWLGDNFSWWHHLRMSIPMLLNIGLSGIAFAGVDIGGFAGDATPELLVRWYETGIFYPFFRNHCSKGERAQEPWAFGEQAEQHIRRLIEMRYRLLPYIRNLFWEHQLTGAPLMRPLAWHYGHDPVAWEIDDQFMFGEDLLVAPIVECGKEKRTAYFPEGKWYPLSGGPAVEGGATKVISVPLGSVPAYVREGAIIPLVDLVQSTRDFGQAGITFNVFGDDARGHFYDDDGISLSYKNGGFDKWDLAFTNGELKTSIATSGYKGHHRDYFVDWAGKRYAVTMSR